MDTKKIKEKSHSFEVEDVFKYGSIEKALIMKEIKQMSVYKLRHKKRGWVYYSASALEEKFPYMKKRSILRWLDELIKDGHLLVRIKNKKKYDKTKSYLPAELKDFSDYFEKKIGNSQNEENVRQNDQSIRQNGVSISQNGEPIPSLSTTLSTSLSNNKGFVNFSNFHKEEEYSFINKQPIAEENTEKENSVPIREEIRTSHSGFSHLMGKNNGKKRCSNCGQEFDEKELEQLDKWRPGLNRVMVCGTCKFKENIVELKGKFSKT